MIIMSSRMIDKKQLNARVRVFVPTYRRNKMLERAINSLRAQTFNDWICEVHNDDPTDRFPSRFINSLNDNRFDMCNHERNLGPRETFNLFFRPTREPYYTMLEDDNWWCPEFLSTMTRELDEHPNATLAWCNMKVWQELSDGSWHDTGQYARPLDVDSSSRLFVFGDPTQMKGYLHANAGMLIRSKADGSYTIPADWPLTAEEAFRERMIPHPLLYVPKPLANFGHTLQTARSESRAEWEILQAFLVATFLKYANYDDVTLARLFFDARKQKPAGTNALLHAALIEPRLRNLLRYTSAKDWVILLRGLIRRPNVAWCVMRSKRRHLNWWLILDKATAARFAERGAMSVGKTHAHKSGHVLSY
jgi:glycosyltransferase involved in cell wall biosynthesis